MCSTQLDFRWVGLDDDSPVIPDQIDNEKRPQLAPGRAGWEGNLESCMRRTLLDNKHLQ